MRYDELYKTHYRYYGNEEGDGYEVYYTDFPSIRGFGDTYDEALDDARENFARFSRSIFARSSAMTTQEKVTHGVNMIRGEGVVQDKEGGLALLLDAYEEGSKNAAYCLGLIYDQGLIQERDEERSMAYFKEGALAGIAPSQYKLGMALSHTHPKEAMGWLIVAAHNNEPHAQKLITYCSNAELATDLNLKFRSLGVDAQEALIQETITTQIAPALQADGGGVEMLGFVPGDLPAIWLKYQGHCSGCHLSSTTTAQMILETLEKAIDKRIVLYLW